VKRTWHLGEETFKHVVGECLPSPFWVKELARLDVEVAEFTAA
jgi:hypothetical protein